MTQDADTESTIARLLKLEFVWIILIPLIGTAGAFMYQYGYFSYFGVPAQLIRIGVPQIAFFALVLFAILFHAMSILFAFWMFLLSKNAFIKALLHPLNAAATLGFVLFLSGDFSWKYVIGIFAFFYCYMLFRAFRKRKEANGFVEALDSQVSRNSSFGRFVLGEKQDNSKVDSDNDPTPPWLRLAYPIFAVLAGFVLMMLGGQMAAMQTTHWTCRDYPDMIVVEFQDDHLILQRFDPQTMTIGNEIMLVDRNEASITCSAVPLGRLTRTNDSNE